MITNQNAVDPFLLFLYQIIEEGIGFTASFFETRTVDPFLAPSMVRWYIKERLDTLQGTDVHYDRVILANNGIELLHDGQCFKIFKATPEGELPAPGRSKNRRDFFQGSLAFVEAQLPPINLVILWDVDYPFLLSSIELVCPTKSGPAWQAGQALWSVTIPHPSTVQSAQTFNSTDAEVALNYEDSQHDDLDDIQEAGAGEE